MQFSSALVCFLLGCTYSFLTQGELDCSGVGEETQLGLFVQIRWHSTILVFIFDLNSDGWNLLRLPLSQTFVCSFHLASAHSDHFKIKETFQLMSVASFCLLYFPQLQIEICIKIHMCNT